MSKKKSKTFVICCLKNLGKKVLLMLTMAITLGKNLEDVIMIDRDAYLLAYKSKIA